MTNNWYTDDAIRADKIVGPVEWTRREGDSDVRYRLILEHWWNVEWWCSYGRQWRCHHEVTPHEALALREQHYRKWLSQKCVELYPHDVACTLYHALRLPVGHQFIRANLSVLCTGGKWTSLDCDFALRLTLPHHQLQIAAMLAREETR